ncbi:hypothetical protein Bca52824_071705 [Brassica carinata]|uniref:Uncharacterized protein n=1 Tax=Brassica carinata TaxID=52824 RepID=A0A8X7Q6I3_BRACI|nr:hypothetical protein Bca52824_071705 [Brassica carinata]
MGSLFILRCFLLFLFLFQGAFAAAGKIWSRTEMVEMAGYGEQKLSSVIIAGSLLCDTSRPHLPSIAIPVPHWIQRRSKWIKAVTDDLGEFEIDLPSQLHAIPDMENTCVVKPVHVPKLYRCNHRSTNTHKRIKLVSSTNGFRVYTSGKIKLQVKQRERKEKTLQMD